MSRVHRLSSLLLVASALLLARPAPGRACSFLAPGLYVPTSVPSNGALYLQRTCGIEACTSDSLPAVLEVFDVTANKAVTGELVYRDFAGPGTSYWKPDAPLTPGHEYEVRNVGSVTDGAPPEALPSFTAIADSTFALSDVSIESVRLERQSSPSGDEIVCSGPSNSCGFNATISTQRTWFAFLSVIVTDGSTDNALPRQFVMHGKFTTADGTVVSDLWSGAATTVAYSEASEKYCYDVTVHSLIDDTEVQFADCVAHGALGDLGDEAVPQDDLYRALVSCDGVVDAADQALWCDAQRAQCAAVFQPEGSTSTLCDERIAKCPEPIGAPNQDDQETDAGAGTQGDAGVIIELNDHAGAAGAPAKVDGGAAQPESSNCSVVAPGEQTGSAMLALCALLFALVSMRARRVGRS